MKGKVENSTGTHDGYDGGPGTYILQDGLRIAVDPVTLKPLSEPKPEPAPAQAAEKPKPASEPAKKTVSDANLTE
ncbi:MAG: hypothetical protein Q8L79_03335 [Methylobacter sp.]|uniref:hypothetical protein n=1 Tax=Methylobacter sp. TaxID=2051955 RepID=UPI00272F038E|nr:hypothetical protein [Methylobacter sp.]MDP1664135.1 hypothetical protein [Methylobacter sp.]